MNLTEKYPRIKPEAIKPVRHHTDWGTRLMFHPDLFPKYKGTRYDVLDETDTLHTGVLWEGDSFQAPFPQRRVWFKNRGPYAREYQPCDSGTTRTRRKYDNLRSLREAWGIRHARGPEPQNLF